MDFRIITSSDGMWNAVRDYADGCSWKAGKSLADAMDNQLLTEWERLSWQWTIRASADIARRQKQTVFQMCLILLTLGICLLAKHIEETD